MTVLFHIYYNNTFENSQTHQNVHDLFFLRLFPMSFHLFFQYLLWFCLQFYKEISPNVASFRICLMVLKYQFIFITFFYIVNAKRNFCLNKFTSIPSNDNLSSTVFGSSEVKNIQDSLLSKSFYVVIQNMKNGKNRKEYQI